MLLVGPHGSGKSTLLLHLAKSLGRVRIKVDVLGRREHLPVKAAFEAKHPNLIHLQVRRERATDGHCLSSKVSANPELVLKSVQQQWHSGDILLLDGLEQLRPWTRLLLPRAARRADIRVLATSHRQHLGFTELHRTEASLSIAEQVVSALTNNHDEAPAVGLDQQLKDSFTRHEGNMREVLMDLYDCAVR